MIRFEVSQPPHPPRMETHGKMRLTIGRSPRSDLVIDDRFTSRLHAELKAIGDLVWVVDLGSANGTRVNGKRIEVPVSLGPGDHIQIGQVDIRLLSPQGESTEVTETHHQTQILNSDQKAGPGLDRVLATMEKATGEKHEDHLEIVSQVGVALLSSGALESVFEKILDFVGNAIPMERAFVILKNGDQTKVVASRFRTANPTEFQLPSSVRAEVMDRGRSVLTADASADTRFKEKESVILSGLRSLMAVPLSTGDEVIGMISVDSPVGARLYSERDLKLLTTIASVAAIKVENSILERDQYENERLREEMESAHNIQARLMPSQAPPVEGYDLTGISLPCYEVGGDYFDFLTHPSGDLFLALGDVSGKGLDAAITMSSLHASVQAQVEGGSSLQELQQRVNTYLCRTTPYNRFATLFSARLNPTTHRLRYINAGNAPALHLSTEGIHRLEATSMPVGMMPDCQPLEKSVQLAPGDILAVFSDGLTEAENEVGEEFGLDRIEEVLQRYATSSTPKLRDKLDERLAEFAADQGSSDDLTVILLKRLPAT